MSVISPIFERGKRTNLDQVDHRDVEEEGRSHEDEKAIGTKHMGHGPKQALVK